MNAQEANRLAIKNKYHDTDRYLEEVFQAIKNCSQKGGFSIDWYGEINREMKDRLEYLGYKVTEITYHGELDYEISWE